MRLGKKAFGCTTLSFQQTGCFGYYGVVFIDSVEGTK